MSLERYFQRAHDEARRLLREWPDLSLLAALAEAGGSVPELGLLLRGLRWPFGFYRVLDRAMVDTDGRPTLAAGEGAEARRLLEMVDWDRVPQSRWPDVFDALRMAAMWRKAGCASWLATTRTMLAEDGWLAATAERSAA